MRRTLSVKANVVASGRRAIPPIRQASIRTPRESVDPTRCMLGSGQFGRCNLPAIFADVPSGDDQALQRSRPDWAVG